MALRWMNPNATIFRRETRGQGTPELHYTLCAWSGGVAEVSLVLTRMVRHL